MKDQPASHGPSEQAAHQPGHPRAQEFIDPVCGMTVDPATAAAKTDYLGKVYYFCHPNCLRKFQADPGAFVGKPREPEHPHVRAEQAPKAGAGLYVCPMCPGIEKPGPGACPRCGMALEPRGVTGQTVNPELLDMTRRFWISGLLTLPLLAFMAADLSPRPLPHDLLMGRAAQWAQLALVTPVVLWGAWPFFVRAWRSIVNRMANMFTLIGMAVGVAYGYSVAATIAPGIFPESFRGEHGSVPVYYEAAAVITVLVLLGQVLELRARGRTGAAIRALLQLAPVTARVVRDDGTEADIPLAQVRPGDRLRVLPGQNVPVDGEILEGHGALDESMITGESIPVAKQPGDSVIGGTLNGARSFVMRAQKVGPDTLLARIVRMVNDAQRSRAPIQRVADKVSRYFVPAVVIVAAVTFVAWALWGPPPAMAFALLNAVAVLIIACPCALGLATPMSIMVGTGRGAMAGVLIKNAEALEMLEQVDTVVVDKTGTITAGKPQLASVVAATGWDESDLLRLAASLERGSEHPLAGAILAGAQQRRVTLAEPGDFESVPGKGIRGAVDGRRVILGNPAMLQDERIDVGPLLERAEPLRRDGQTVTFVAADGRAAGLLGVADPIKPTTPEAIDALHAAGIRIVMLTGDHRATAEAVARKLRIDEVMAEVLPEQKHQAVRQLQQQGRTVAMAGDGVNDAPALAQAHVGIAMGTGTDVAMQSAGVTLVKGDLRGIVRAIRLSRRTMRNIRQNLFLAFVYNVLAIPLAAGVLYPAFGLLLSPMIAAAAMSFSSVSVIANALRLRNLPL